MTCLATHFGTEVEGGTTSLLVKRDTERERERERL